MDPENPTPLEESPDVSLQDIFRAVKQQDDLKNEVHGFNLAVVSQVKKLKVDNEYHWKYEGNKVEHTLSSEFVEDLNEVIWAIEHCKLDYARETVVGVIDKLKKPKFQQQPFREPQSGWYSGFPLYSNMPSTSGSQPRVQQGACYGCGSNQHWRNRCPFNPKAVGKPKTE
ncbi:Hypothetical predicted protein [Mytilus galloprovincialis]|uniref:CCHC-type domain-containing protein n=1 Tax=Mytilus galloprovincialis TaxID=29158 RepID=A0A8B6FUM3_MYTGA|nr:Hypothetical predicted protein [Mytilus galloprovincialis]